MFEDMMKLVFMFGVRDDLNETERGLYEVAMTYLEINIKIFNRGLEKDALDKGLLDDFDRIASTGK